MRRRDYKNLIVIAVLLLITLIITVVKTVNFNDLLLTMGRYDRKITIINTADVHGHILYDEDIGYHSLSKARYFKGLPLLKSLSDRLKQENPDSLFLDCGDLFHGTNEANIEQGKGIVEIANLMGYNAMAPGNHDFNFGIDRLLEIRSQLNFPIICSNITQYGRPVFEEYRIIDIGGIKIGLFGLIWEGSLSYANSQELNGITIEDARKATSRVLNKLRNQVDLVVLMSHLGDDIDVELVEEIKGIDLVLCAHHHRLFQKAEKVNQTYLVGSGAHTTHIGVADLYFKGNKLEKLTWRVMTTADRSRTDPEADAIAQKYHAIALKDAQVVIGKSAVLLNGLRSQVRSKETNLANLLTDAMKEIGHAEIALMNGGGIRQSFPAGEIDMYKVGKVLPFYNSLITVEVEGEQIYQALERGLHQYPNGVNNGCFLQVSGISYVFDGSKPAGAEVSQCGQRRTAFTEKSDFSSGAK